jgi:hypothetical protein
VDLSRESVQKSPVFDASQPVSMADEDTLYDYYGRPRPH